MDRPPCVVYLHGATFDDYKSVEDAFEEKVLAAANIDVPGEFERAGGGCRVFDALPTAFAGLADWPERCNLSCWGCGLSFAGRPVPIPVRAHSRDAGLRAGRTTYDVEGVACSFNCAVRHALTRYHRYADRQRVQQYLLSLYEVFNGVRVAEIAPAEPRHRRQEYGGPLSAAEYVAHLHGLDPRFGRQIQGGEAVVPDRDRAPAAAEPARAN